MRVIFAIDAIARVAHTDNFPACLKWARDRSEMTGRPIKIVACRGGEKYGKTIAEVNSEGVRLIHNGMRWSRGKLRYVNEQE